MLRELQDKGMRGRGMEKEDKGVKERGCLSEKKTEDTGVKERGKRERERKWNGAADGRRAGRATYSRRRKQNGKLRFTWYDKDTASGSLTWLFGERKIEKEREEGQQD